MYSILYFVPLLLSNFLESERLRGTTSSPIEIVHQTTSAYNEMLPTESIEYSLESSTFHEDSQSTSSDMIHSETSVIDSYSTTSIEYGTESSTHREETQSTSSEMYVPTSSVLDNDVSTLMDDE